MNLRERWRGLVFCAWAALVLGVYLRQLLINAAALGFGPDFLQFVKDFLTPGSVTFLLLGLVIGLLLLYSAERAARWGRRWLMALAAVYWALSTPFVSELLAAGLQRGYTPIRSPSDAAGADAVVVLAGGSLTYRARGAETTMLSGPSAFRALEAARVYALLDDPWVIVSGGVGDARYQLDPESEALRAELLDAGVPAERILIEPESRNTREQALNVGQLLRERGVARFVLVTSPSHMWRALATFRAAGLDAVPSISADRSEGLPEPLWWLPAPATLIASQGLMREYLALVYYWSRGWLAPTE